MLLEEAVLHLLKRSGYSTVEGPGEDPTLCSMGAGTGVRGRGTNHQIDAIADFVVNQPFSNPQRLLVEAKCYAQDKPTGIDVVRNAIGVLKDTSEYWQPPLGAISTWKRFHYQYAVFSGTSFSSDAQRYAFAHDIHLFPLHHSQFFKPILAAVYAALPNNENLPSIPGGLSELRKSIRVSLRQHSPSFLTDPGVTPTVILGPYLEACAQLNYALVAILGGKFTILLTPSETVRQGGLDDHTSVRIYWNEDGWLLKSEGRTLFSFDLPDELFKLYEKAGEMKPERALDLKSEWMSNIQTIEIRDGRPRLLTFRLDQDWINAIRQSKPQVI